MEAPDSNTVPRMILRPPARGRKAITKDIRSNYDKFLNFKWADLLDLSCHSECQGSKDQCFHARKAAMNLLRVGELSHAAQALTSSGLAPASEKTVTKLATKHIREHATWKMHLY